MHADNYTKLPKPRDWSGLTKSPFSRLHWLKIRNRRGNLRTFLNICKYVNCVSSERSAMKLFYSTMVEFVETPKDLRLFNYPKYDLQNVNNNITKHVSHKFTCKYSFLAYFEHKQ